MQKILTAFLFLFLAGAIFFLWEEEKVKNFFVSKQENLVINEKEKVEESESEKVKGIKRKETIAIKLPAVEAPLEVEVVVDEKGIFLSKIGEMEVNQQLTDKEVYSLDIKNGILKFWEIHRDTNNLKFKSINLVEFLIQFEESE